MRDPVMTMSPSGVAGAALAGVWLVSGGGSVLWALAVLAPPISYEVD